MNSRWLIWICLDVDRDDFAGGLVFLVAGPSGLCPLVEMYSASALLF